MIDWVKAIVPWRHSEIISGGRVTSTGEFGEIDWEVHKRKTVEGSYSSVITIQSDSRTRCLSTGDYTHMIIDGNPVKFLQGHNIWGSGDLIGLMSELVLKLSYLLNIPINDIDFAMIVNGVYRLLRVDSTMMLSCGNNANVDSILYSIERLAHMRYKGKALSKGSTLYFGQHSRRESLKLYNKAKELKVKGHELPMELQALPSLLSWVEDKLRVEAVTRSMQLKELDLDLAFKWGQNTPSNNLTRLLDAIEMSENCTLTPDAIQELPARLVAVYHLWKEGHDLKGMYPSTTFKRYRKQLQESAGIDIAIIQGDRKEPAPNVVEFRRVLTPERAEQVPAWAIGTDLYFEPRARFSR